MMTRRQLLRTAATVSAGVLLNANPLELPVGLQLWTVKDNLKRNFAETLQRVAAIGYKEVELFELPIASTLYQKRQFASAGLSCVSGHFYLQQFGNQQIIDRARDLGLRYMIVVFPTLRSLADHDISNEKFSKLSPLYEKITLDDYKWNADEFNKLGETLKKNGLQLGYHNHAIDFKKFGDTVALDELIRLTDPNLVKFELDCGHVIHAGHDPIAYLKKYPTRIELLHLKDLKPGFVISNSLDTETKGTDVEIGAGSIDWKNLFQAAKQADIQHYFVEHEGAMAHPPLEAIKISYDYLHGMPA